MRMSDWKSYWTGKTQAGHRFPTEEFYQKKAREELFHLQGGQSLIDFGCGAGDLLVYIAGEYPKVFGVDFSPSMLEKARKRVKDFNQSDRVTLIEGDAVQMWGKMPDVVDRICSTGVVQYMGKGQIDAFLGQAAERLPPGGKVILFDVIDPLKYFLLELGLFGKKRPGFARLLLRVAKRFLVRHSLFSCDSLSQGMGRAYYPDEIEELGARHGLTFEYVSSLYYEYRYHVIFTR